MRQVRFCGEIAVKNNSAAVPLICFVVVVVLDQLTKWWIMSNFAYYETRPVVPGLFNLTYVTNTGAAFGFLAGSKTLWRQVFFVSIAVVALVGLFAAYRHFRANGGIYMYAIGLIAGGAAGNVIDRLRFGAVVDFLDFYINKYHWPAFNVADSAITTGVGLFLLATWIHGPENKEGT